MEFHTISSKEIYQLFTFWITTDSPSNSIYSHNEAITQWEHPEISGAFDRMGKLLL